MNNLLKKFIEFAFGSGIVLILGFISSPIITRLISPEEFGKFSMFNTITNLFLVVLVLGLDQAYVRYYYDEDEECRIKLLRKCITIPLLFNLILSILLIVLYKKISIFVIGEYSFSIVLMIILQNTFNIIGRFMLLLVRMKQKGKAYSLLQIIGKISYIGLVLLIFKIFKNNYRTLVFAIILSNIISVIINIYLERREIIKFNSKLKIRTTKKELLNYGIPLVFTMAITWIFQSVDRVFINIYSGYNELGLYSSAFSIVALLNAAQATFTTFWVPVANERYKISPDDKTFFSRINSIVSLGMIIIGIFLITFKDILIILLGEEYRKASFIFPFLVFMPIMYTVSETTVIGINFSKKTKYHIYIAIGSAICNIIGNTILVPIIGAKGAAISTGLSYVLFFILRTLIANRFYKVDFNLGKFIICTIVLTILSIYASFNSLDLTLIIIGVITLVTTLICYRHIIIRIIKILKTKVLRK